MLAGKSKPAIRPAVRRGVGVSATTDGDQRERTGMIAFEGFLSEASPVAAKFVEFAAESRAMAGVVDDQRAHMIAFIGEEKHGQRAIDRAAGILTELDRRAPDHTPVAGESDSPLGPGKFAGAAILERSQGDLLELIDQFARVAVDDSLLFRW